MDLQSFALRLHEVERVGELWAQCLDFFHSRGVRKLSYHGPRLKPGGTEIERAAPLVADGYAETWVCDYVERDLVRIDPIPALSARMTRPFLWRDLERLTSLTDDNRRFMQIRAKTDPGEGLAIQVFAPTGQTGYVGLGFGNQMPDLTPPETMTLQLAAQLAHIRYCEIIADRAVHRTALTRREQEVLQWIARGKSNHDIAAILNVSPQTVKTLVKRTFAKLDVGDRTRAAVTAIGAGLIQL